MAATALAELFVANMHVLRPGHHRNTITSPLPEACCAGGITRFLYPRSIRIFGQPRLAEPQLERRKPARPMA